MAELTAFAWLRSLSRRIRWEGRRGIRTLGHRFGVVGAALALCGLTTLFSYAWRWQQIEELRRASTQLQQALKPAAPSERDARDAAIQGHLAAFEARLVAFEDSPLVLQGLIDEAKAQGLSLPRGAYLPTVDRDGGFLRYQMTLPLKGQAEAVPRFIVNVLASHKSLALESAQFKRERGASQDVEARLQFALMTRPPRRGAASSRESPPRVGDKNLP